MSASPQTPDAILRRLEWTVLRRLDGLLHGAYRTLFRGAGLDLADLREYQLHDDVRHIDWNVTARTQALHVRQYLEDREVIAWFLVDLSPSVDFGSSRTKREVLVEFVVALAHVLSRHGNPVGAIFYGNGIEAVITPRTGRPHVLHLLHKLKSWPTRPAAAPTDLGGFLRAADQMMRRRSLVLLVSDFITTPGWTEALARVARRHDAVAIRLGDPAEQCLPPVGLTVLEDSESGEQLVVDTSDPGFRRRYADAVERRESRLRTAFGRAGVDALELSTDEDLLEALLRFAALRKRRGLAGVTSSGTLEAVS